MSGKKPIRNGLSEREKFVLTAAAIQGIENWKYLYCMSRDCQFISPDAAPKAYNTYASRWKAHVTVADYFRGEVAKWSALRQRIIDDGITNWLAHYGIRREDIEQMLQGKEANGKCVEGNECNNSVTKDCNNTVTKVVENEGLGKNRAKQELGDIDYTDAEQLLAALSRLANDAKDSAELLDTIKVLAQLLKARPQKEEDDIARFYAPLKCGECELYLHQKQKLTGK